MKKHYPITSYFTLCTVLCTYSQSAVYVIFTSTNSDDKGVNNLIF